MGNEKSIYPGRIVFTPTEWDFPRFLSYFLNVFRTFPMLSLRECDALRNLIPIVFHATAGGGMANMIDDDDMVVFKAESRRK